MSASRAAALPLSLALLVMLFSLCDGHYVGSRLRKERQGNAGLQSTASSIEPTNLVTNTTVASSHIAVRVIFGYIGPLIILFMVLALIVVTLIKWSRDSMKDSDDDAVGQSYRRNPRSVIHSETVVSEYEAETQFSKRTMSEVRISQLKVKATAMTEKTWEIPFSVLRLDDDVLGSGSFGTVHKAEIFDSVNAEESMTVAVKLVTGGTSPMERRALRSEIMLMQQLEYHPNIMCMVACCTLGKNTAMVMEYYSNGTLRSYLEKHRASPGADSDTDQSGLTMPTLLRFTKEIAQGMDFLSVNNVIHQDLAARSVLVSDDLEMKVANFGVSKDAFYRAAKAVRPTKWMAIEVLNDGSFTIPSDIWSFGVLLWEIITLGSLPYPDIADHELLNKLSDGYRMPQPQTCPDDVYQLMLRCWHSRPEKRPHFNTIIDSIDSMTTALLEQEQ